MSRPIVLLDMDGVMVNHNQRHLDLLNEEFGTAYTYDQITDFEYSFLTSEQREFIFTCWKQQDLYAHDALTKDQLEVIDGLREIARVVACSSPMEGHIRSKYAFLTRYFEKHNIVLTRDKTLVGGDILVDDAPHNIKSFPGHAIVFDQPWNRGLCCHPRARTFEDIGPLVQDYITTQEMTP